VGRWNPSTGELVSAPLDVPRQETTIITVGAGPDGKIYGSTYETQHLYSFDPATGSMVDHGLLHNQGLGQVHAIAAADGKLFLATYTHGRMTVYDPTQPWDPGSDVDSNPRHLGRMGTVSYRPTDSVVGSDGRVWVSSQAGWGRLGGALVATDPQTYDMQE
jgi:streptogramin lyase